MSSPKEFEAAPLADHKEVNGSSVQTTKDMDEHEKKDPYATGTGIEIDAATNKRLFWKINRRILVIQLVTYFCQSLDKGTLNFASIMGIKDDAKLVGQEVN